jgi:cytoskeletal protein CcmA (bactofilin family)
LITVINIGVWSVYFPNNGKRTSSPIAARPLAQRLRFCSRPRTPILIEGIGMAQSKELPIWPEAARASARRSIVAADLVIEGDVTSAGAFDIEGRIVGSIQAPQVVVAATGRVEGSVIANDLTVLGSISGSVSARNVQLGTSAVVHADVLHERIAIEAGAEMEGLLQRHR